MTIHPPPRTSAADIHAALRLRYAQPEWAIMFEVANGTGAAQRRYADAIAMNLFPSRGLCVHGFEVKVSRSDWQRELKAPQKAEEIARYCDYWWVVTPPGIVRDGELPETWGLLELAPAGVLKMKVKAGKRLSAPLDASFVAAMLRRAHQVDDATVTALVEVQLETRMAWALRDKESEINLLRERIQAVETVERALFERTGLHLRHLTHDDDELATHVRVAAQLRLGHQYGPLRSVLNLLQAVSRDTVKLHSDIEAALNAFTSAQARDV